MEFHLIAKFNAIFYTVQDLCRTLLLIAEQMDTEFNDDVQSK